jgi:ATP-dependent Clp protease protease subunit
MASLICAQMLFLESEDSTKDITLMINSPGGDVIAGLQIYDTMNFILPDVATIVTGQAASMGSFLAMAGAKGKRYVLPSSRTMIHQPLGGARGQATDIEIHANEIIRIKSFLTQCYSTHCGVDIDELKRDMERDYFLTAKAAVNYGLADKIIANRSAITDQ